MVIVILVLAFLWLRAIGGVSDGASREQQAAYAAAHPSEVVAQQEAVAAYERAQAQGLPTPPRVGVTRSSGLSLMGDHATELSDPGLARDPSSINGGTV